MHSPVLAFSDSFHEDPLVMVERPRAVMTSVFEREAGEAIAQVKQLFADMIAVLGVRRPVDLQRKLKLDVTLSWQIFKVAAEASVLAAGASMPSRANAEKFARNAGEHGVSVEQMASLSAAYDRFEDVVARHAGDRTSFISLVTAAAGLSDDWLAADLQHRRQMFRGMSHVMGVQARARIMSYIVAGNAADGSLGFEIIVVGGYVNLRTLRQVDRVRVHGVRIRDSRKENDPGELRRGPLNVASEGCILPEFCSDPMPEIRVDSGTLADDRWTQTSIVRPEVGNLGVATLMFGEHFAARWRWKKMKQVTSLPTEVLVQDLLVPAGLIKGSPRFEVFLGDDRPADRAPDMMPVVGDFRFERIGRGAGVLATPEFARYPEMIRSVAQHDSIPLESYDVWRVRMEYPVYQSMARVSWRFADDAEQASVDADAT